MASSLEEFTRVIEGDKHIDIERLRRLAYFGVPEGIRGKVWKLLLDVPDYPDEEELRRSSDSMDVSKDILERCAEDASEVQKAFHISQRSYMSIESIVLKYFTRHPELHYSSHYMYLICPFASNLSNPKEIECCYLKLLDRISGFQSYGREMLSLFYTVLPSRQPILFNHFDGESVSIQLWTNWFHFFLCKELKSSDILRLFDTYFSIPDFEKVTKLHVFVCIALLEHYRYQLLETAFPQQNLLANLPHVDMDKILTEAQNIQEEWTT